MRVLIVEDESHVAAELQEALGSLIPRIDTVTVGNLSSGIEVLRSDEFDLIVCDLKIPPREGGIDAYEEHGLAVHEEARTVCPGTPCLFFTGLTTSQAIVERLSSGATRDILGTGEEYEMIQLLPKPESTEAMGRGVDTRDDGQGKANGASPIPIDGDEGGVR